MELLENLKGNRLSADGEYQQTLEHLLKRARAELPGWIEGGADGVAAMSDSEAGLRWFLHGHREQSHEIAAFMSLEPPAALPRLAALQKRLAEFRSELGVSTGFVMERPLNIYLAVHRIHLVEGLFELRLPLVADGRHARRGGMRGQTVRQRDGRGARQTALKRDLAPYVARLHAEMVPAQRGEPLVGQKTHPEKKRHVGLAEVVRQPPRRLQMHVLQDVGGIDAPFEPRIHSQLDHPPQPLGVAHEQLPHDGGIPVPSAL